MNTYNMQIGNRRGKELSKSYSITFQLSIVGLKTPIFKGTINWAPQFCGFWGEIHHYVPRGTKQLHISKETCFNETPILASRWSDQITQIQRNVRKIMIPIPFTS